MPTALVWDRQIVQQQLSDGEKVDKQDDSPVTVADYGEKHMQTALLHPGNAHVAGYMRQCTPRPTIGTTEAPNHTQATMLHTSCLCDAGY